VGERIAGEVIEETFACLTPKERSVMVLFFGLTPPYEVKTLQEIGSLLHVSLERVRQIREGALKKLKETNIRKILE